jgi:pimeloyl-ACP methyl ester carboxylesterase
VHCWSGGGPAAYRLAVRHPGRVRSIVAFAAVSRAYPTPRLKLVDRLLLQTRPGNRLLSYVAAKQPQQFVTGVLATEGSLSRPLLKERVAHVMANPAKRDFVVGLGLTAEQTAERRIGYDNDLREFAQITTLQLDRISAPTLVVHGTADSDVPFEHGAFAASQIPGADLLSMESGTHLAFYTHPDSDEAQRRAIALLAG